jgi:hypothetical protein
MLMQMNDPKMKMIMMDMMRKRDVVEYDDLRQMKHMLSLMESEARDTKLIEPTMKAESQEMMIEVSMKKWEEKEEEKEVR